MSELVEQTAQALRMVELIKFSMAEEVFNLKVSKGWKDYVRGEGAQQPGTHPGTFRKFLEDYTREVRDRVPGGVSTGQLEDWVESYEWLSSLGLSLDAMAVLTTEYSKRARKVYASLDKPKQVEYIQNALAEITQFGKLNLAADRPEGKIEPVILAKDLGDSYQLLGITLVRDGVPFRNRYPKQMLHWMSKRLRAAVEVSE